MTMFNIDYCKILLVFYHITLFIVEEIQANPSLPGPYIHVDVYPSMTGVTRFLYENENKGWKYNRTELLTD